MTRTDKDTCEKIHDLATIGLDYHRQRSQEMRDHERRMGDIWNKYDDIAKELTGLSLDTILRITRDYYGIEYYQK